jgi:hypothetical protein
MCLVPSDRSLDNWAAGDRCLPCGGSCPVPLAVGPRTPAPEEPAPPAQANRDKATRDAQPCRRVSQISVGSERAEHVHDDARHARIRGLLTQALTRGRCRGYLRMKKR